MALVVITGGARSGKSAVAQELLQGRGEIITVATFGVAEDDAEMDRRIQAHQAERPAGWRTLEIVDTGGWLDLVEDGDTLLVDCLGTFLGRVMQDLYEEKAGGNLMSALDLPEDFEELMEVRLEQTLDSLIARSGDTLVVTNEVGDGVVPTYATGRVFRDVLGRANRKLTDAAEAAYLVVAGRCLDIHSLPRKIEWPFDPADPEPTS